jgi:serine/threonine protein kinase
VAEHGRYVVIFKLCLGLLSLFFAWRGRFLFCCPFLGTPDYLAPEIVSGKGHGKAVDWWTVGVFIFEMLASYPPFFDEDPMKTYAKIMHGTISFPSHFSKVGLTPFHVQLIVLICFHSFPGVCLYHQKAAPRQTDSTAWSHQGWSQAD